jgi:hypothetical protein
VPPADPQPLGVHLPGPAHIRVHQGLAPAAVRCALGYLQDLGRLDRQQRQGYDPDTFHLQAGRVDVEGTGGIEVAGTADLLQQGSKICGKDGHGPDGLHMAVVFG